MVFVVRCFRLVGNDGAAEGAAAGERHMKMPGGNQMNKQRLWKLILQVLQRVALIQIGKDFVCLKSV